MAKTNGAPKLKWAVIYYEDTEPEGTVSQPPQAGHYSRVKVLVPCKKIADYVDEGMGLIRNPASRVSCTIVVKKNGEARWTNRPPIYLCWDRAPAHKGFFTFYHWDLITLDPGSRYYHKLSFLEGDSDISTSGAKTSEFSL
ncbi:hypothetical protein F4802DRAFT_616302 [Xylaria palmicola]|nr:hypothetical protein F4802DRAFT_616302 [Xylaria palmicola]